LWLSDSLSLFDRLDLVGPVIEDDDLTADIHAVRAAYPSCRIFAVHVFSHCGIPENEAADELAAAAAGETARWWKDDWRIKKEAMHAANDAAVSPTIDERQRRPQGPSKQVNALEAQWIAQLQCGVCAALGGNRHGHDEDCYNCGAEKVLGRGGRAVKHMFACTAMAATRTKIFGAAGAKDDGAIHTLWTAPAKAVAYARRFWAQRPYPARFAGVTVDGGPARGAAADGGAAAAAAATPGGAEADLEPAHDYEEYTSHWGPDSGSSDDSGESADDTDEDLDQVDAAMRQIDGLGGFEFGRAAPAAPDA
jgi:hypothetical protein